MLRTWIKAAKWEGRPLETLSNKMKWFISFTAEEIDDMEKLLMLLDPMERLFTRLGSQTEPTIHLVVPTLLVSVIVFSLLGNLTLTLSYLGSSQYSRTSQRRSREQRLRFCERVVLSDPSLLCVCSESSESSIPRCLLVRNIPVSFP